MSGPKRADVQAALNIAARSAQASAAVISRADRDAVGHMSRRLSDALKDATSLGSSLEQAAEALAHVEHQGSDTESARKAVEAALAALGSGLGGTVTLAGNSRDADAAEDLARQAYDEAQAEYDKAEQGLRQAGSHYLHNQMAWAQNARMKFDEAGQLAQRAAELRTGSKRAANKAVERAEALRKLASPSIHSTQRTSISSPPALATGLATASGRQRRHLRAATSKPFTAPLARLSSRHSGSHRTRLRSAGSGMKTGQPRLLPKATFRLYSVRSMPIWCLHGRATETPWNLAALRCRRSTRSS